MTGEKCSKKKNKKYRSNDYYLAARNPPISVPINNPRSCEKNNQLIVFNGFITRQLSSMRVGPISSSVIPYSMKIPQ